MDSVLPLLAILAYVAGCGLVGYFLGKRMGYRAIWVIVVPGVIGYVGCVVSGVTSTHDWAGLAEFFFAVAVVTPFMIAGMTGAAIGGFHQAEMARNAQKPAGAAKTE